MIILEDYKVQTPVALRLRESRSDKMSVRSKTERGRAVVQSCPAGLLSDYQPFNKFKNPVKYILTISEIYEYHITR